MTHAARIRFRLFSALLAASLAFSAACAQTPPAAAPVAPPPAASPLTLATPVGIVDQPCPPGSTALSPAVMAFAKSFVTPGPMDRTGMATWAKEAAARAALDTWRQKNDWADLCHYRTQNEDAQKDGPVRVVFLGDSITELWKVADPSLFTGGVVDRGVSGQTSAQLVLRFQQDVVALRPQAVHILVGTNDVAGNTGPERAEDLKNNIRAMVTLAKANHIRVILGAISPTGGFPWRPEIKLTGQIPALNAWLAAYARAEGATFVDYYAALAGADGAMKPGISRDGVHPLIPGYGLMECALAHATARGPIALAATARCGDGG